MCERFARHRMARDLGNDLLGRVALNAHGPKNGLHRLGRQKIDPDARVEHKPGGRRVKHAKRRPLWPRKGPRLPVVPTDRRLTDHIVALRKGVPGPAQSTQDKPIGPIRAML